MNGHNARTWRRRKGRGKRGLNKRNWLRWRNRRGE